MSHRFKVVIDRKTLNEIACKHGCYFKTLNVAMQKEYRYPFCALGYDTNIDDFVFEVAVNSTNEELMFFLKTGLRRYEEK